MLTRGKKEIPERDCGVLLVLELCRDTPVTFQSVNRVSTRSINTLHKSLTWYTSVVCSQYIKLQIHTLETTLKHIMHCSQIDRLIYGNRNKNILECIYIVDIQQLML